MVCYGVNHFIETSLLPSSVSLCLVNKHLKGYISLLERYILTSRENHINVKINLLIFFLITQPFMLSYYHFVSDQLRNGGKMGFTSKPKQTSTQTLLHLAYFYFCDGSKKYGWCCGGHGQHWYVTLLSCRFFGFLSLTKICAGRW